MADHSDNHPKTRQELKKKGKYNTKDKTYNSRNIRIKYNKIENSKKK